MKARAGGRDDLLARVQRGEITPADAESEARRQGLEGFALQPDPDDFDPMQQASWSLPMAVAWIAYREAQAVQNWWGDYRQKFAFWRESEGSEGPNGGVRQGHILETRSVASLARLIEVDSKRQNRDDLMTAEAAIVDLCQALRCGDIDATGIDEKTGRRVKIPARCWSDRNIPNLRSEDVLSANGREIKRDRRFHDLRVPMEAMRSHWPERPEPQLRLPALMKPEGPGYMPLYCAAQWIATRGGSSSFDPEDESIWKLAYDDLLARIASEQIAVIGTANGERQPVPGYHFAACRVSYPYSDTPLELLFSEDLYLCSAIYLDEEHWLKSEGDFLENRHGPRWVRLVVRKSDVLKFWPFEVPRTGAPGRPSSIHLVEIEFEARCGRDEVHRTLAAESEQLANWFRQEYPHFPPMTAKTIKNRLRDAYSRHKKARK